MKKLYLLSIEKRNLRSISGQESSRFFRLAKKSKLCGINNGCFIIRDLVYSTAQSFAAKCKKVIRNYNRYRFNIVEQYSAESEVN